MADLDDFFAKKDKKKGKSKKFMSSEELVKQLENAAKEKELSKKPAKIEEENGENPSLNPSENDDEWKEFEPEKKSDLSNLKLGQLSITDEQQNQINQGIEVVHENLSLNDGDNSENPWNKSGATQPATSTKQESIAPAAAKSGVYVPPSVLRGERDRAARNKKNAPDLQNEEFFPSLGTEKPLEQPKPKKDGFEEVKHGGKFQSANDNMVPVSVGNKYSSLFNDDS